MKQSTAYDSSRIIGQVRKRQKRLSWKYDKAGSGADERECTSKFGEYADTFVE